MKYNFRLIFGLIFSTIILYIANNTFASNDLITLLEIGDEFYELKNYDAAITEYQRFICFSEEHPYKFYAYYKLGLAHSNLNQLNYSNDYFKKSIRKTSNLKLKSHIRFNLANGLFQNKEYDLAIMEYLKLSISKESKTKIDISPLLIGLCLTFQQNWKNAKKYFSLFKENQSSNSEITKSINQIDLEIDKMIKSPEKKSPVTAKWLSTFLPGLGQIYTGNIMPGLNSFSLNGLNTYYLFNTLEKSNYRDVVLIFFVLWLRYYQGNREKAEKFAHDINTEYKNKTLEHISYYVIDIIESTPNIYPEIKLQSIYK